MQSKNWTPRVRLLHWLSALLVVGCIAAVWSHEAFEKTNPLRGQLMQLHFLLGLLIGVLTVGRLATRLTTVAPAHSLPPLIAKLAKLGHLGLYAFLLALPVAGYVAVSGRGLPLNLFDLVMLPPLPVTKDIAHTFKEAHEVLGNGLIALVAIHVSAAAYHAIVLKDKVVQSMLGSADH